MRTILVSVLVLLAQPGIRANAQAQAGTPLPRPGINSGYWTHPSTNRLFFFMSDPKDTGRLVVPTRPPNTKTVRRPLVFARPPVTTQNFGVFRPLSFSNPVPRYSTRPAAESPRLGLLPGENLPPQDLWRLYKPKNSRLFFFNKP